MADPSQDAKISALESRAASLEAQVSGLASQMSRAENKLDNISDRLARNEERLNHLPSKMLLSIGSSVAAIMIFLLVMQEKIRAFFGVGTPH